MGFSALLQALGAFNGLVTVALHHWSRKTGVLLLATELRGPDRLMGL